MEISALKICQRLRLQRELSGADDSAEPSGFDHIPKGAMIGAAAGLPVPGIVVPIVGFAAAPTTGPIGQVVGATAGASAYDHPDYKPEYLEIQFDSKEVAVYLPRSPDPLRIS